MRPTHSLTMYDSTNAADIPHLAEMVAGYIDGNFPTWFEVRARFHHLSPHYTPTIATSPMNADRVTYKVADVLDVEPGNFKLGGSVGWPLQYVGQWINHQRSVKPHQVPVVYVSLAFVDEVKRALDTAKVPHPAWWIADWTGVPHLVSGSVATQYADPTTSGGHFDLSVVSPDFPTLIVPTIHLKHPSPTVHDVAKTIEKLAGKSPTTAKAVQQKGQNVQVNLSSLETLVRKLGSYAVVVNDFTNTAHISPAVKSVLTAAAGLILSIDHWVAKTPTK